MKVSELIEALKQMPQDAKVIIHMDDDVNHPDRKWDDEVRDVIYNDHNTKDYPHAVELDNWPREGY